MYEHIFDQEVQKKMDDFFLKNLASHGKLINFKKGEIIKQEDFESKLREDPQIYHYFLISIILTHEEIANRLGLNRITVTNTMNQFRDRGLIDIENRKIIIKDIDTLRKMTNILV